ncbi:hypothetical protein [Reinekea sp.]|uniref:hypothetical protein n=1 Tax=Reinekea sp. TaxID=1970455 RepID=UPI002A80B242|nr:hypothetical protein [Reinekea sp.]
MAEKTPAGDLPRMVPDRDDIRNRNARIYTERKPSVEQKASVVKSRPHTSWAVALFLIVAGVAIGYLALQQYSSMQLLNSYEERLMLADERIVSLEQSLTQTDESVSMNGTAINAQFKAIKVETDLQMDEIRKLWDVANKRNRSWIEANQVALAEQIKNVGLIEASLAMVQADQTQDTQRLAVLSDQLSAEESERVQLEQQLKQNTERLTAELAVSSSAITSILDASYDEQLLTLTLTQELAIAKQNQINTRQETNNANITELLGAIQAVDAGRLETNKRLTALSGQLDTVNARLVALTGE